MPRVDPDQCAEDCDITDVTDTVSTWIGTIYLFGAIFSGPASYFMMGRFGRKWTLVLLALPLLVGYVILTLTRTLNSPELILVGRFLTGE